MKLFYDSAVTTCAAVGQGTCAELAGDLQLNVPPCSPTVTAGIDQVVLANPYPSGVLSRTLLHKGRCEGRADKSSVGPHRLESHQLLHGRAHGSVSQPEQVVAGATLC